MTRDWNAEDDFEMPPLILLCEIVITVGSAFMALNALMLRLAAWRVGLRLLASALFAGHVLASFNGSLFIDIPHLGAVGLSKIAFVGAVCIFASGVGGWKERLFWQRTRSLRGSTGTRKL